MAAPLNQRQFFHASHHVFEPGDTLSPYLAPLHEGKSYEHKDYPPAVYMADSESRSKKWAASIAKNRNAKWGHVYEVEPVGEVQRNQLGWGEGTEYTAGAAKVKEHRLAVEVTNPGRKEIVPDFLYEEAKTGRTLRGEKLRRLVAGEDIDAPKRAKKPRPEPQVKGQRSLFPATAVVDSAPERNLALATNARDRGYTPTGAYDRLSRENYDHDVEGNRKSIAGDRYPSATPRNQQVLAAQRNRLGPVFTDRRTAQ